MNFSFYNSSIFENEMCYKLIHMQKFEMENLVHNLPVYRAGESFKKILWGNNSNISNCSKMCFEKIIMTLSKYIGIEYLMKWGWSVIKPAHALISVS